MSKVDRELFRAKYGDDPVKYFKHLPDVESVEVCHDEIKVTYKRDTKHIFPVEYGRCTENSISHSVRIPFKRGRLI